MSDAVAKANLRSLAGMLRYARPYRAQWAGIVVLTLLTSAFALLTPWPMQVLVDHVLGSVPPPPMLVRLTRLVPGTSETRAMIGFVVFAGLVLLLVGAALDALLTIAWVRVGQRMVYDLACDLFARIQRRSLLFHTRNSVGDLLARVTGDSWCVYSMVELLLLAPGRAIVMTVHMVAPMARLDWKLTHVARGVEPFMGGASYWLAPPIRLASKLRREVETRLLAHVQQTLSGIPVVQAFAAEQREQQRFRAFADAAVGAQRRTTLAGQFHELGTGLVASVGSALVLWLSVRHVLAGTLTLGGALVFVAYLALLQEQMRTFVTLWATA